MQKNNKKHSTTLIPVKSGGKKVPLKIVKEEDTKNEWGMIEDQDEIDFNRVLAEEKER